MDHYHATFPNQHAFQLGYVKNDAIWIDGTFKLHYGCSEAEIDQALSKYFVLVRKHVQELLSLKNNQEFSDKTPPSAASSPLWSGTAAQPYPQDRERVGTPSPSSG